MRLCFVVNWLPLQKATYTTTHLAFEAIRQGHEVYYTTGSGFSLRPPRTVFANAVSLAHLSECSREGLVDQLTTASPIPLCLNEMDYVFLRQNPNDRYSENNQLRNSVLDFARILKQSGVQVINDPDGLVLAGSKHYLSSLPQSIRPKTFISRSPESIKAFIKEIEKPVILKPLHGYGGKDVFYIRKVDDININQIVASLCEKGYLATEEFIANHSQRDKRVLLFDGEPLRVGKTVAIYQRLSCRGEIRSNLHLGSTKQAAYLSSSDEQIIDTIRPHLAKQGLRFVGIDILEDKLLEINVFCPGGLHTVEELYQLNFSSTLLGLLDCRRS